MKAVRTCGKQMKPKNEYLQLMNRIWQLNLQQTPEDCVGLRSDCCPFHPVNQESQKKWVDEICLNFYTFPHIYFQFAACFVSKRVCFSVCLHAAGLLVDFLLRLITAVFNQTKRRLAQVLPVINSPFPHWLRKQQSQELIRWEKHFRLVNQLWFFSSTVPADSEGGFFRYLFFHSSEKNKTLEQLVPLEDRTSSSIRAGGWKRVCSTWKPLFSSVCSPHPAQSHSPLQDTELIRSFGKTKLVTNRMWRGRTELLASARIKNSVQVCGRSSS